MDHVSGICCVCYSRTLWDAPQVACIAGAHSALSLCVTRKGQRLAPARQRLTMKYSVGEK